MASGDLADEVVGPEQAKLPTDDAGSAAAFFYRFRRGGVEQRLEVFVPEAVDDELAAADDLQQASVRIFEGVQRPYSLAAPGDWLLNATH